LAQAAFYDEAGNVAAAESFALVAADILFLPVLNVERDKAVPRSEARRFFKAPSWRRIKSASSNDLRDMSMSCGQNFPSFLAMRPWNGLGRV